MAVLTATVEDFTAVGAVAADRSVLMFRTDRFDAETGLSARQWHAEVVGGVLSTQLPDMSPGVTLRISASSSIPGFKSVAVAGYPASITLSELLTATNPDGTLKYVVDPTTLEPMQPLPPSASDILVRAGQARDAAEVAQGQASVSAGVSATFAAASEVSADRAGTSSFNAGAAAATALGHANDAEAAKTAARGYRDEAIAVADSSVVNATRTVSGDQYLVKLNRKNGPDIDLGDLRGLQGLTGDMTPFTNGSWVAGAQTVNAAAGAQTVARTLTGNVVLSIANTPVSGRAYTISLSLKQDGTGGRTITWPAAVVWPEGLKPTLPVAPNALATYHLYWDGVRWIGIVGGLNLA